MRIVDTNEMISLNSLVTRELLAVMKRFHLTV